MTSFSSKDIAFFRRHIALSIRAMCLHSSQSPPGWSTAPGFVVVVDK